MSFMTVFNADHLGHIITQVQVKPPPAAADARGDLVLAQPSTAVALASTCKLLRALSRVADLRAKHERDIVFARISWVTACVRAAMTGEVFRRVAKFKQLRLGNNTIDLWVHLTNSAGAVDVRLTTVLHEVRMRCHAPHDETEAKVRAMLEAVCVDTRAAGSAHSLFAPAAGVAAALD